MCTADNKPNVFIMLLYTIYFNFVNFNISINMLHSFTPVMLTRCLTYVNKLKIDFRTSTNIQPVRR